MNRATAQQYRGDEQYDVTVVRQERIVIRVPAKGDSKSELDIMDAALQDKGEVISKNTLNEKVEDVKKADLRKGRSHRRKSA